jgi:hypothetical protein
MSSSVIRQGASFALAAVPGALSGLFVIRCDSSAWSVISRHPPSIMLDPTR